MIRIPNWINGKEVQPRSGEWLEKFNPHTGLVMLEFASSSVEDVDHAITTALGMLDEWSESTAVYRGNLLFKFARLMADKSENLARCIATETGKPPGDAAGEVKGATMQAEFFAGEGMRLYGRSLTSGMYGKSSFTIRQARGVAGLIVPANTPIANVAWKLFPALICGNTVVLKASEDAPGISHMLAEIAKEAGIPDGVVNVVHGRGQIAGAAIAADPRVDVVSFTGSTESGKEVAKLAGSRLATLSLELGGKNPFIVCNDANLQHAVKWAALSVFSNAGQRCSSASRILVFPEIYESFVGALIDTANSLKIGISDGCDLGPVVNARQQARIFDFITRAVDQGGKILCGGGKPDDQELQKGFYVQPTLITELPAVAELNKCEIFGPVASIQKVHSMDEVLAIANDSEFGLTSAIHTKDLDKAFWFARKVKAGVANINIATYGSEPHMPFGGYGVSGNGTREPGVEALDIYSELKNISVLVRDDQV